MIIIGEKINGTREEVAKAIQDRDSDLIRNLTKEQSKAGADYLDVNAGTHPRNEPSDMAWLVKTIQEEAPGMKICLDSANPEALLAGIEASNEPPLINSLSGEKTKVDGVLPLALEHGLELVILALDDQGIPGTSEKRVDVVRHLVHLARQGGLNDRMLYIDPLVTTIATDNQSGQIAFESIRQIRKEFPEAHITCGLSNISFGQPCRTIINQAFAALAIGAGMDSAILDPCEKGLRSIIYAAEMVLGQDTDCLKYNRAHRNGQIGEDSPLAGSNQRAISKAFWDLSRAFEDVGIIDRDQPHVSPEQSIDISVSVDPLKDNKTSPDALVDSLVNMKKSRVIELANELIAGGTDPMEILDASKRAMGEVGRLFEIEEYFVPELILAGKMLKDIADIVKPHLKTNGRQAEYKGRVLIGTVEGDIHDIGKDIVVTMLEVNGYEVMDLGVDVPVLKFIEATQSFKPSIIGLSGFLTLAFDPMKETIAKIKQAGFKDVKCMLGGGQIDEQVRVYTGADAFGRDAMEAVKLCDQWMGN